MLDGRSSATALRVARQRAAHQIFDDPLVFPDRLALALLGEGEVSAIRTAEAEYRSPFSLAFRAGVVARSRFSEDTMLAALDRGVRQVVVLGAGLDTFAYRCELPPGARVVEVDHPATQAWKRQRLHDAGVTIPLAVSFVPLDFDRVTLAEGLYGASSSSLDPDQPTYFSWLGVTYYLPSSAVEQTLSCIAAAPAGSGVVFDYFEPAENYRADQRPGFTDLGAEVGRMGEPWLSYSTAWAMADLLAGMGFDEVDDRDSTRMAATYFGGRGDGLAPTGPIHFVHAARRASLADR